MALAPVFKKAYYSLAILTGIYFLSLTILLNPWAQRQVLYLHNVNTVWLQSPNQPSRFGFLKGQVQPFFIRSSDGEQLYGWHVLPLELYAKHEMQLQQQPQLPINFTDQSNANEMLSSHLLRQDPEATVVVNFHGNAGTVSQGWRTDTYRLLTALSGGKVHLITIDYRGFGYSSGTPDEEGIITDGVSLVQWIVEDLQLPAERIVFAGQSLGTAVAVAVAERLATHANIAIKNIVLVSAFANVPSLLKSYRIAGFIPVLAPLNSYPALQNLFLGKVRETWYTSERIATLMRQCKELNLHIIHAKNDPDIPWQEAEKLFHAASNATSERGMTIDQINAMKNRENLGNGGFVSSWTTRTKSGGKIFIRQEVFPYGGQYPAEACSWFQLIVRPGHNRVTTYPVVANAVLRALRSRQESDIG